ncbi:MAG: tRNA uridine-5-carboxymethylaminomethyl(34) synthesis GTPase MnmE [Sulfitobacter sp.]
MDTIFAQATAAGRAGVSVVRISGPDAFVITTQIVGALPASHQSALRLIRESDGSVIDQALVLVFSGPKSFTGEDVVELQLHGSIAVMQAVLRRLSEFPSARLAEPGEFTRRALENGKLDLAQVEGLSDLIEAETEAQRKQALRVFSGHLGTVVDSWRADLIRAAALLEATIDFADEDVPVDVTPEVSDLLDRVSEEIQKEVEGSRIAERIRSGFEVAIVGAPNAGKSTLLNALAGRDAAITSEVAGTTRDIVEVRMHLDGLPVTLLDTAGLRESDDKVESIGIERAMQRAAAADLRVFLMKPDDDLPLCPVEDDIAVHPKADLYPCIRNAVSGNTGVGLTELVNLITGVLKQRSSTVGVATHERHRSAMLKTLEGLELVKKILSRGVDEYDIAAEELRSAVQALEVVVGRIGVENLLDEIFLSFCIGK